MSHIPIVAIGSRCGRLVAKAILPSLGKGARVECLCDCGRTIVLRNGAFVRRAQRSCGCLMVENRKVLHRQFADKHRTHGESAGAEFRAWIAMRTRCNNPNASRYKDYGGRGIRVCDRWNLSFAAFLEDMGHKPTPEHTVDRFPDPDGNYEPGNCRWATKSEQGRNQRRNHMLSFQGETLCMAAWAERLGVSIGLLNDRINKLGWPVERALAAPVRGSR